MGKGALSKIAALVGVIAMLGACAGGAGGESDSTRPTVMASGSGQPSSPDDSDSTPTEDSDATPTSESSSEVEESEFSPAAQTGLIALCGVLVGPEAPSPPANEPRNSDPASIESWLNFFDSLRAHYVSREDQMQSALASPEFLDAVGNSDKDAVQDYVIIQAVLEGMLSALDTEELRGGPVEAYDVEATWRRSYRPIERLCPKWDGETWSSRS